MGINRCLFLVYYSMKCPHCDYEHLPPQFLEADCSISPSLVWLLTPEAEGSAQVSLVVADWYMGCLLYTSDAADE